MTNDVAVFLDLDNLVIGAKQLNLAFDISLILDHIRDLTNGRVVLRRAYGDWRQNKKSMEELTASGFTTQSTMRMNSYSKNLADMQIVVDTMETLVDGHEYTTYVLITGDRDFTPLVHSLRKRNKQVLGIGLRHAASRSLISLCDHYAFYEDLVPSPQMSEAQIETLMAQCLDALLADKNRVRASILKQAMNETSRGAFDSSQYAEKSFRKFLVRYPNLVELQQEGSTTYVRRPTTETPPRPLHQRYRTSLKRQRLRVPPANQRLTILKDVIKLLQHQPELRWRQIVDTLAERYGEQGLAISKNVINAVLLVAREAQIINPHKGRSLAAAPVVLQLEGSAINQEAVVRCDAAYLRTILDLSEFFDLDEAAIALYDDAKYAPYLQKVMNQWMDK